MNCNCNRNRFYHRVLSSTAGANLELTTTFSDNINDKDPYKFFANRTIVGQLPDPAVAVTVEVNGVQVPLWNKYGVQILSSAIPRRAFGYYSEETTPHVILITTPETVTIP